jgi:hypothetical protein
MKAIWSLIAIVVLGSTMALAQTTIQQDSPAPNGTQVPTAGIPIHLVKDTILAGSGCSAWLVWPGCVGAGVMRAASQCLAERSLKIEMLGACWCSGRHAPAFCPANAAPKRVVKIGSQNGAHLCQFGRPANGPER